MFCDLVGSTALSAKLDPEDLRGIIAAYHPCCTELIERHGGFVTKYMGDGVLAYFGYPQAHEYDAARAVRTRLNLVEAVPKLASNAGSPLQVRVGVATSLPVVGDLITNGRTHQCLSSSSAARRLTISRHRLAPHGFLERVVCCEVDDASSAKGATNLPD